MAMTTRRINQFRRILESLDGRVREDLQSLEDQARTGLGGEAGGNLSGAPMHLADLGTEQYMQELNATLLENEGYIRREVVDALGRIDGGEFGVCEHCGQDILEERLEVLPYTRYCTACSAKVGDGERANLNDGRPGQGLSDFDQPFTDERRGTDRSRNRKRSREDIHAAGTAGGGTAIGGLAGTNIGDGDPDDGDLEEAMGSGNFDQALEGDDEETSTYSGQSGGSVGGSVADRRAKGGKTGRGISPRPRLGESPVGQ
ncbi:TraR/DksA family transcriptional regulator [Singulisphaera sp. PoT]|uniref:TraR/DksA family transcriptional regulator n=1 Tax=Singulisphaera sp. PoT TaxID=3411797 RepID=UPI003BF49A08